MVTWLACPRCGGVFIVQRSSEQPPGLFAPYYMHRDGSPVASGEAAKCDDCGYRGMKTWIVRHYDEAIRHAEVLPPPPAKAGRSQRRAIGMN